MRAKLARSPARQFSPVAAAMSSPSNRRREQRCGAFGASVTHRATPTRPLAPRVIVLPSSSHRRVARFSIGHTSTTAWKAASRRNSMPRLISVMRAKVVPWTSIIASSRGPDIGAAARQSNRARRDARAGPKRSEAASAVALREGRASAVAFSGGSANGNRTAKPPASGGFSALSSALRRAVCSTGYTSASVPPKLAFVAARRIILRQAQDDKRPRRSFDFARDDTDAR